ncbi:MAG: aromatic-ring-hydroxylating dioxygenase beta subunit [Polaromonas sp.]|nr:aromatic-ring-hydroxylating dioxygenase beta subunit [Polaromonas sp.]
MRTDSAPSWTFETAPEHDTLVRQAERFLFHEAWLLDNFRFDRWLDLYTEDAVYWVPLELGQADPFTTHSLMYDDKRLMQIRVRQQTHPRAHARLPLSRTVHQVSNVLMHESGQFGEIEVSSTLILFEYRKERQRSFAATVLHRLRLQEGDWKISHKRVDLINSESELDGIAFLF